ncbi:MAG: hypothetical protein U5R31_03175 [Acidimicrobiia bacterium]|nr:hypothetical protein [Acidimicrobiia bacterium]
MPSDRSPERITDDVVRCLRIVEPMWLRLFSDDASLFLHVRSTLDDLEALARDHGTASTGCIEVTYDPDIEGLRYSVQIATQYDPEEAPDAE